MPFPVLEINRLVLDELSMADSNSIFELFSNELVVEHYDLEVFTELSQATKLIELFTARFTQNWEFDGRFV